MELLLHHMVCPLKWVIPCTSSSSRVLHMATGSPMIPAAQDLQIVLDCCAAVLDLLTKGAPVDRVVSAPTSN